MIVIDDVEDVVVVTNEDVVRPISNVLHHTDVVFEDVVTVNSVTSVVVVVVIIVISSALVRVVLKDVISDVSVIVGNVVVNVVVVVTKVVDQTGNMVFSGALALTSGKTTPQSEPTKINRATSNPRNFTSFSPYF